jgi:hypothetical protein
LGGEGSNVERENAGMQGTQGEGKSENMNVETTQSGQGMATHVRCVDDVSTSDQLRPYRILYVVREGFPEPPRRHSHDRICSTTIPVPHPSEFWLSLRESAVVLAHLSVVLDRLSISPSLHLFISASLHTTILPLHLPLAQSGRPQENSRLH